MEKRVPVDELAIGMFVTELDRPWIDTPFLLQGFLIQDEETLAQLRSTCSHVIVDLYRSDTGVVGEVKGPQAPSHTARTEPKVVRVAVPAAPPTAPARRKIAVTNGFSSRIAPAEASVSPLFKLTVSTLLPLPGSCGSQCEHTPTSSPAAAMPGISSHESTTACRRARSITRLNPVPTATASGDITIANVVSR